MNQWDEAASDAVLEMKSRSNLRQRLTTSEREAIICTSFAQLRETYDALRDCVECLLIGRATNGYLSPHWQAEMNRRLENPIIQAAIERSRKV